MTKKRVRNIIRTSFFCFLISILILVLVPFALSAIEIVIDQNTVGITAVYKGLGDVGVRNANITNLSGERVYRDYQNNLNFVKTSGGNNISFSFYDSNCKYGHSRHPCVILDEGEYTFHISVYDPKYGRVRSDSKDFRVDLTPCNNNGVQEGNEECDGNDLNNKSCEDLGFQGGGTLSCSNCHFDTSKCMECTPGSCSICTNQVCSDEGVWVTTNYTLLCGALDSDLGDLAEECDPGACDLHAKKFCDDNGVWTADGYCDACSDKDSSCSAPCTKGACDIKSNKYCTDTGWESPPDMDAYCYLCEDYDSECEEYYSCTGDACDTEYNKYCDDGSWVSDDYCEHCGEEDADCGIPLCIDGECDTCAGAKKYCNKGVWEGDGSADPNSLYCDASRCGGKDPECERSCLPGYCDFTNKKYCDWGLWDSGLYCEKCKDKLNDPYCSNITINVTQPHCNNNVTDEDESDTDCGGADCPKCESGRACIADSDCVSNYCYSGVCGEASCSDGVKNGFETDVDCGGGCEQGCNVSQGCAYDSDCLPGLFCNPVNNTCAVPSCDDGYQNGEETDVDCGNGCAEKCGIGAKCRSPNDCESGFCDAGTCSLNPDLDTDEDGMPDKWEISHGLDPNRNDADEDLDGDDYSNLDEYLDGTDPADANDPVPKEKHTLQIVLLVLGLLLMLSSTGFLIYSRRVLGAGGRREKTGFVKTVMPQRQKPFVQRPVMTRAVQPTIKRKPLIPKRLTRGEAARKDLLRSFGKEETPEKPGTPGRPGEKEETGFMKRKRKAGDEFVPLSRLVGKPEEPTQVTPIRKKKKPSPAFEKLKEIVEEEEKKSSAKKSAGKGVRLQEEEE